MKLEGYCGKSESMSQCILREDQSLRLKQPFQPNVVFVNETKKEVPEIAVTNYTALSSSSSDMPDGVALSFRYYVAFALMKELENKDNDKIVAAANIRGPKTLTTTAYIIPI